MLDLLTRTILNHKPQAISDEAFHLWKDNPVTQALMFEMAHGVLDNIIEPLPKLTIADVGAHAISADAARAIALQVIEWSPLEAEA